MGLKNAWLDGKPYSPCTHHKEEMAKRCIIPWDEANMPPEDYMTYYEDGRSEVDDAKAQGDVEMN